MNVFFKKLSGFSLIELIVSIAIISLGMIGVLSLVVQNTRAAYVNKNALIASQLAQEGLELVRNIRDTNWLIGADWKTNAVSDGNYTIDYAGSINSAVNSIDDEGAKLYLDDDGYYSHQSSSQLTNFSRLISVIDSGDYLQVTATVRWREGANYKNYISQVNLYNWR